MSSIHRSLSCWAAILACLLCSGDGFPSYFSGARAAGFATGVNSAAKEGHLSIGPEKGMHQQSFARMEGDEAVD
jgi:hypothetical protein